ncbi:acyltransferase family protein [Paraburkholderia caballeronis]|uniref:Peptidoglycan/LPS O-acetylase OafA/YrhL, contains acyltransferase and SGNH-hydrolase domains n=1 Tax=Paraburkholderia caballeronis TaxID=416943 RepID=A0A1H7R0Q6_9BURK|nr:acyltransferase [Paraburkholderia caballeronis]PXW23731.1 peptidoglycan/LPS O-acetylase OafA/YrhL [Paraburkholderia caballeronis]PXW99072.1 peptidoglycan/LPS O-acetylase OafA/YrhL [Paraburkholderia caballeronis]RAJ96278.1 peptidoglycan/LPS O-acetylase OafA/YrhL [Paraburkholderia caballeronis]SEC85970.1 Peptidoglycan/LPS O-acetylase OafA/YrhL, contains acyltransferase and SGNH-hydrolase domains [Paraburkholderia caballeronis]SEL53495.1 Peptidoglycan/LPS O-acetylase OafA/YrhL, contains acyltr
MATTHFPLWAGWVATGAAFAAAALAARRIDFFRDAIGAADGARFGHLDGLRGYLAFAVFVTHAASSVGWYRTGVWAWPDSVAFMLCGRVPVALFFMITGFLFTRKVVTTRGRLDWKRLYAGRLRRLAPLYLLVTAAIFVVVGQKTGWVLREPPATLFVGAFKWLGLGVLGHGNLNGLKATALIDPAMWTLRYEWIFYAALPAVACFATPRRAPLLVGLTLLLVYAFGVDAVVVNFLFGAFAALLHVRRPLAPRLCQPAAGAVALVALGATALPFARDYGFAQSLLLSPLFACALYGNALFGALTMPAARVLGLVSYSVYLTHGVLLYAGLQWLDAVAPVAGIGDVAYAGVIAAIGVTTVGVSLATFRFVEYPFMKDGRAAQPAAVAAAQ